MKWKTVIGIVLVVLSIAAMYLWETKFEDQVTQTEVLVPEKVINVGDAIELSKLKSIKINPSAKIDGALSPNDAGLINGKIATTKIEANQQILKTYFKSKSELIPDGYVNFVIPSDWVFSKSSLIGAKDRAKFYSMPDKTYLGTYRIDLAGNNAIEVIARLEDYFIIYDSVVNGNGQLLLVMEEDV